MKKFLKIGIVLVFIVMFVFTNIYAFSINDLNGEGSTTGNLKATGNKTITILSVIGSLISVIVLIVLGIKYMLGSTEEKAEYKKRIYRSFYALNFEKTKEIVYEIFTFFDNPFLHNYFGTKQSNWFKSNIKKTI